MRLLFISHSFPPENSPLESIGGMQRVAVELAAVLAEREDLQYQQCVLRSSWKWHHIQCVPWLGATAIRLHSMAMRRKMDIVLFSSMVTAALAPLLRRTCIRANIPLAAIAHGRDVTLPGIYQTLQVRRTLCALDCIFPVSRATGAECEQRGMPPHRVQVIPNGVRISRYPSGVGGVRGLQLLSVGRLVKRKGFAWFIDQVMPELPSHVHYRIVGTGPELPAIQKAITVRGLQGRVHLLGRCSDQSLVKLYGESDLFIMPNLCVPGDMEGFGVVMLESSASGTPAIAADLEGIRDVITQEVNGKLVPSGNVAAFKDAILSYPVTAEARACARRHTVKNFSWVNIGDQYVRYLRKLRSFPQSRHMH